jgi:hypothetical protein
MRALIFVVAITALAIPAGVASGSGTGVTLHPGQSKKVGIYTVVCTEAAVTRTKTRIVLRPGYQVKLAGLVIACRRAPAPTPTPTPTPAPTPSPAVGTRGNPFPVGTRVSNSAWAVTVNNTNFDAWPVIEAANIFNDPPSQGGQDVLTNFTISYLGPGSTTLSDLIIDLGVVGQSGVEYKSFVNDCGVEPSPSEIDYSTLFSGATIQLNLCWQVASNDASTLELVYNDQSWLALK